MIKVLEGVLLVLLSNILLLLFPKTIELPNLVEDLNRTLDDQGLSNNNIRSATKCFDPTLFKLDYIRMIDFDLVTEKCLQETIWWMMMMQMPQN